MVQMFHFLFWIAICMINDRVVEGMQDMPFTNVEVRSLGKANGFLEKFLKDKFTNIPWINLSEQHVNNSAELNLQVVNGKTLCGNNRTVVEVKLFSEQPLISEGKEDSSVVFFTFGNNSLNNPIGPYPLSRAYTSNVRNQQVNILPENFEGYVTCLAKGDPAILTPKYLHREEFNQGPWMVKVHVSISRNPLMPFGMQPVITVIDNAVITQSGRKVFFWPFGMKTELDVYLMVLAEEDSLKNKTCTLSKEQYSDDLKLHCETWKTDLSLSTFNKVMLSVFTGMNFVHFLYRKMPESLKIRFAYKPFRKWDPEVAEYVPRNSEEDSEIYWGKRIIYGSEKLPPDVNTGYAKTYDEQVSTRNKIFWRSNLAWALLFLIFNGVGWAKKGLAHLKRMALINRKPYERLLAYPWKLEAHT